MQIYIPSLARAGQANHTFENLPPDLQARTHMVVSHKELSAYSDRFGNDRVFAVPVKGIGKVRQAIIDMSNGPVLMLDDDLRWFTRRVDDPTKFTKSTVAEVRKMISAVEKALRKYAHVAIAPREGGNRNIEPELYNTRCLRALGFDASVLRREGVRFDRVRVMEDFDVALQLLRLGYTSCSLNRWVQDQTTSNAPGGCSEYRTLEVQARGAQALAMLHPEFVTTVEKTTLGAWGGTTRTDVRVAWKKAFGSSRHAGR